MTFSLKKKLLLSLNRPIRPQDVFATSLYTGNGGTQTITNGLDLAGKGGLTWNKIRSLNTGHYLFDTVRGSNFKLATNATDADSVGWSTDVSFLNNGVRFDNNTGSNAFNQSGQTYVNWSFRRAKKFFDIVTYTGNGQSGRQIPHGLGDVPGMIVVKARSATGDWAVWHRGKGSVSNSAEGWKSGFRLNGTEDAAVSGNGTPHSSSTFDPAFVAATGAFAGMNANGVQYVAYLFAHNPDLIDCGSYVGTGSSAGPTVTCGKGWRPQFLITKAASAAGYSWAINDAARGFSGAEPSLFADQSAAESATDRLETTATGFQPNPNTSLNAVNVTYVYLAIRSPT